MTTIQALPSFLACVLGFFFPCVSVNGLGVWGWLVSVLQRGFAQCCIGMCFVWK